MSDLNFFVSEASIRNLKLGAAQLAPQVSSSHISEAIAASVGFRTYAALRAALAGRTTVETPKPSNAKLIQRLKQLGYSALPDDMHLVLEFAHSYTPFRNHSLTRKRGVRRQAWRNLVVAAVNAGLEQRVFGLAPGQNLWPGGAAKTGAFSDGGSYRFMLTSGLPAVVAVNSMGADELTIEVVLNPKLPETDPGEVYGLSGGDAVAHCWVERRLGAWIQDAWVGFACKRNTQAQLLEMAIEPHGYSDLGSFIL